MTGVPELAEALPVAHSSMKGADGVDLAYYADRSGPGRPLVLVHSINAAPSSFEVKPLFEQYRGQRPVYSLDLPGFGHSARPARGYRPEGFADALNAFLKQVVRQPADVLALSLSSEFAARAALERPQGFASLTLISPTGFSDRGLPARWIGRGLHRLLSLPGLSQALYGLVASKRSIRYYLGRSFVGEPASEMIDHAWATSHQPGARHAPLVFLSTLLFTPNASQTLYAKLTGLPVLAIADRDPYIDFETLPAFIAAHPNWRWERIAPNLGLPHWECLEETVRVLDAFWS